MAASAPPQPGRKLSTICFLCKRVGLGGNEIAVSISAPSGYLRLCAALVDTRTMVETFGVVAALLLGWYAGRRSPRPRDAFDSFQKLASTAFAAHDEARELWNRALYDRLAANCALGSADGSFLGRSAEALKEQAAESENLAVAAHDRARACWAKLAPAWGEPAPDPAR
jgi:hypothetical protein